MSIAINAELNRMAGGPSALTFVIKAREAKEEALVLLTKRPNRSLLLCRQPENTPCSLLVTMGINFSLMIPTLVFQKGLKQDLGCYFMML
jgi:hypothetical protein